MFLFFNSKHLSSQIEPCGGPGWKRKHPGSSFINPYLAIFWSFNSVFIVDNYLFPNVRTGWHRFLLTANYIICCFMSKNIPLCFCVCVPTYAPPTDPESQRKRTVQNVLDLRQNLEETMTSLRGVQLSHRSATHTHACMHALTQNMISYCRNKEIKQNKPARNSSWVEPILIDIANSVLGCGG